MNLWFHLFCLLLIHPQEAVRREQSVRSLQARRTVPGGDDTSRDEFNITVENHTLGFELNYGLGEITNVVPDGLGEKLGLKSGQKIIGVNGEKYTEGVYHQYYRRNEKEGKPYYLTIKSQKKRGVLSLMLNLPAALLGCCLWLGMPLLCAHHHSRGSCWQDSVPYKVLTSRATLGAAVAFACGRLAMSVQAWTEANAVVRVAAISRLAQVSALVMGLAWTSQSPLLQIPLSDCGEMAFRIIVFAAGLLCSTCAGTWSAYVLFSYFPRKFNDVLTLSFDVDGMVAGLGFLIFYLLVFAFITTVAKMALAVYHQLSDIQAALKCEPGEYFEHVHKPCATFLQDQAQHLSTCGGSLLLLALSQVYVAFMWYSRLQHVLVMPSALTEWFGFIAQTLWFLALIFALMVGPSVLAAAVRDFRAALDEERRRDSKKHPEIRVLELMFEHQNYGQGFGIPVGGGLAFTEDFLWTAFFRFALVGATVKAFLDSELGYAKAVAREGYDTLPEVLANITALVQNGS